MNKICLLIIFCIFFTSCQAEASEFECIDTSSNCYKIQKFLVEFDIFLRGDSSYSYGIPSIVPSEPMDFINYSNLLLPVEFETGDGTQILWENETHKICINTKFRKMLIDSNGKAIYNNRLHHIKIINGFIYGLIGGHAEFLDQYGNPINGYEFSVFGGDSGPCIKYNLVVCNFAYGGPDSSNPGKFIIAASGENKFLN